MQEVIVQNFRAKAGTRMASHPEPSLDDHLWTIAVARILLGPDVARAGAAEPRVRRLPAPPRRGHRRLGRRSRRSRSTTSTRKRPGRRSSASPRRRAAEVSSSRHGSRSIRSTSPTSIAGSTLPSHRMCAVASDASGLARDDAWAPGEPGGVPLVVRRDAPPLELEGDELGEDELTRLLEARGQEAARVCAAADRLRREVCGDEVTYVVTRNIQYTNVCYFRCGFCAFSKGKLAANLRGAPYLVPLEEIVRRAEEAWDRGATEVCLQGGIHPAFTGEYYAEVVRAIRDAVPEMHVHAFSALEIWQGAATLGLSLEEYLARLRDLGLGSLPGHCGGGARRRGSARHLPRQGDDRAVARSPRRGAPRRAALERDPDVRTRGHAALLGAPPAAHSRAAAPFRRLHRVRATPVRPDGGADLPSGARASRPDVPRDVARPCGRAARAASGDHERPGVVGQARARRNPPGPRGRASTTSAGR